MTWQNSARKLILKYEEKRRHCENGIDQCISRTRIARAENNTARMDDLRAERMAYSQEKAMCDQILFELKDLIDEDLYDSESAQTTSDQLNTNLHSQPPKSDLV